MRISHSFVVPSHNHADYVGLTIESLLKQNRAGSEIVVSEDHSTDHTQQVLEKFGDKIRIVRPPEHRGMAHAWNWGVQQARGDWVSLMGADDLALPHFVETMAGAIERYAGQAVLVSAEVSQIDAAGAVIGSDLTLSAKPVTRPPDTLYVQAIANITQVAANCFRRDAWEKAGGFDTRLQFYGDWGLWLKLAAHGDFLHVHKVVANYRIGYRPGIARQRMAQTLRDDATVQRVIIPEIAETMPGVDRDRLRRASRERFRIVLADAGHIVEPRDRGFFTDCLAEWARDVGAEDMLRRFVAGERISTGWRGSATRRVLRRIYRTLFAPSA
ncbi:MAG TPA: glycosyltransferase [Vineibacter sp.]|nr:glycosyltransferase [Vineibacter sp.]